MGIPCMEEADKNYSREVERNLEVKDVSTKEKTPKKGLTKLIALASIKRK